MRNSADVGGAPDQAGQRGRSRCVAALRAAGNVLIGAVAGRHRRRNSRQASSRPSRARRPPAPRARAPPRLGRGRAPSCRSARSRGPGSRVSDDPGARRRRAARARPTGGRRCPRRRRSGRSRSSRPRVDAAVDPREAGRDLVDRPVQVVDPALERDGEVDEVLLAAAEQHPLRLAHAAAAPPRERRHDQRERRDAQRLRSRSSCRGRSREHRLTREREDDRVLGRVVRRVLLARHRLRRRP